MLKQSILLSVAACAAMLFGAVAEAQGNRAEYGYQREECTFESPSESLVICGGITVPENHESKTGKVYLPIVRIMHETIRAETPAAILGGGGPGGGLYLHDEDEVARYNDFRKNLLGNGGELILIDPRGSGGAWPLLDCEGMSDYFLYAMSLGLSAGQEFEYLVERKGLDCVRQWGRRVHLASYTADAMVEDAEMIRRALNIKQWDVIGLSYGTRLALELIRHYPNGVRAAILDSVVPADSDTLSPRKPFESVLERVKASCLRDAVCKRYGDLRDNLDNATKAIAEKTPSLTLNFYDEKVTVILTPARFYWSVQNALNNEEHIEKLPRLALDLANSKWNTPAISVFMEEYLYYYENFALALFDVVTCGETVLVDNGDGDGYIFPGKIFPNEEETFRQYCRHVTDIISEHQPVRPPLVSDKPMIIIAGEYDIPTPVEHARVLANRLPNVQLLAVPMGHTPLERSPCALEITRRFLESPNAPLSRHCAEPPLEFE